MAVATKLENGIWAVQWSCSNQTDQTTFKCEESSFQLNSVYSRQGEIILTLRVTAGKSMFFPLI